MHIEKAEPEWMDGIWFGVVLETHEHIIGTSRGVITCRAIAAVEENKKFSKQDIEEVRGVPWQPVPGRRTNKIPTHIKESEDGGEDDEDEVDESDDKKSESKSTWKSKRACPELESLTLMKDPGIEPCTSKERTLRSKVTRRVAWGAGRQRKVVVRTSTRCDMQRGLHGRHDW